MLLPELLIQIFLSLDDIDDVLNCASVSVEWRNIILSNDKGKYFWKKWSQYRNTDFRNLERIIDEFDAVPPNVRYPTLIKRLELPVCEVCFQTDLRSISRPWCMKICRRCAGIVLCRTNRLPYGLTTVPNVKRIRGGANFDICLLKDVEDEVLKQNPHPSICMAIERARKERLPALSKEQIIRFRSRDEVVASHVRKNCRKKSYWKIVTEVKFMNIERGKRLSKISRRLPDDLVSFLNRNSRFLEIHEQERLENRRLTLESWIRDSKLEKLRQIDHEGQLIYNSQYLVGEWSRKFGQYVRDCMEKLCNVSWEDFKNTLSSSQVREMVTNQMQVFSSSKSMRYGVSQHWILSHMNDFSDESVSKMIEILNERERIQMLDFSFIERYQFDGRLWSVWRNYRQDTFATLHEFENIIQESDRITLTTKSFKNMFKIRIM